MASAIPIPDLPAARLPEEGWSEQALTWLGAGIDSALLGAMQILVDALLMPDDPAALVVDPFGDALRAAPEAYFDFPESSFGLVPVAGSEEPFRELRGGAAYARRFIGEYPPFRAADAAVPAGDTLVMEHWSHEPERRRGTIVLLHGFTMGRPWIDAPVLFAPHWWRAGLDVVLFTLPFHGVRTPPGATFSGQQFADLDAARLAEAVRRAVHEVRATTLWLRERTHRPVGLFGLSLGGYVAALSAGLYDDLDFVVSMVPPVCIGDLAWQFQRRSRSLAGEPALGYEALRRQYRVHSPLAHPLRTPAERCLIVAGRGDRVVPPEHPHALWRHWGQPAIHWYSGGHLSPFVRGDVVRAVLRHLAALGIVQR